MACDLTVLLLFLSALQDVRFLPNDESQLVFNRASLRALAGREVPLDALTLIGFPIVEEDLALVSRVPGLSHLSLAGTNVTSRAIRALGGTSIRSLDLAGCERIDDAVFSALDAMEQLRWVNLCGISSPDGEVTHRPNVTHNSLLSYLKEHPDVYASGVTSIHRLIFETKTESYRFRVLKKDNEAGARRRAGSPFHPTNERNLQPIAVPHPHDPRGAGAPPGSPLKWLSIVDEHPRVPDLEGGITESPARR